MTLKDAIKAQCKFCDTSIEVRERYENESRMCDCPVCGEYNLTYEAFELRVLFRFERGGSRNGLVVLVESRLVSDPETHQSVTIKRYHSEKENLSDGRWRHKRITLSPDNKKFKDIILENVTGDDFRVVAEFLEVLS